MQTFAEMFKISHLTSDGTNYPLSAGTSDVATGAFDRLGYERVAFLVVMGANLDTGTMVFTAHHSDASGSGFAAVDDIDGADIAVSVLDASAASSHKLVLIEVWGPLLKRYVKLDVNRGTANMSINAVLAFGINARNLPVAQVTTAGQFYAAPAVKEVYG